ncbi:MAG TPA: hypothetical protein VM432_02240 [Bdellovibrionales bacterium]|jgi:hypothetical protein|nr:hypothetical protein [Bdellovibrionales bacterium]
MKFALLALMVFFVEPSIAATYFVADTIAEDGITETDARTATMLVKNSVAERPSDTLTDSELSANYVLQPRMVRLGDSYILTVEKTRGQEIVFSAQTKMTRIDQLDRGARAVVTAAIEEPSTKNRGTAVYRVVPEGSLSSTTAKPTIYGSTAELVVDRRKVSYWSLGFGPTFSSNMNDDSVMYGLSIGHTWAINPAVGIKINGNVNFSSGEEGSRFFDLMTGANFFLPEFTASAAPYLTGEIGYGFAEDSEDEDANGVAIGAGAGIQFFRNTETTMDLLIHYTTVLEEIEGNDGNPSIVGARLAVNF